MSQDYDSPWKDALEEVPERFLALLLPEIHAEIDWTRPPEAQEQELRKAHPLAATGKRIVDRLLKLYKKTGDERYLHIELQGYREQDLPRRVFVYNGRASDHFREEVVSVVVYVDADPNWMPDTYRFEEWGCEKTFKFPVVKLARRKWTDDELAANPNVFALFLLGHYWSQATVGKDAERERLKLRLTSLLLARKLDEVDLGFWVRLLDWQMPLPPEAERRVSDQFDAWRKGGAMPFVSGLAETLKRVDRELVIEHLRAQGRAEAVPAMLELKFGEAGKAFASRLAGAAPETWEKVYAAIMPAASLADIEKLLP